MTPSAPDPWRRAAANQPESEAEEQILDAATMLAAVAGRLRALAEDARQHRAGNGTGNAVSRLIMNLLDCATAMDNLELPLRHALGFSRRLELELFDARTALASVRPRSRAQ